MPLITVDYTETEEMLGDVLYKEGVWNNNLKPNIRMNNVVDNADNIEFSNMGDGIWITDLSFLNNYIGMIVIPNSDNNLSNAQIGKCNTNAQLPGIISSGSGRVSYTWGGLGVLCDGTYGVFIGSGGSKVNIKEIILLK